MVKLSRNSSHFFRIRLYLKPYTIQKMKTDTFFKWILAIITISLIVSLGFFTKLLCLGQSEHEALYGIISMSICFIAVIAALLIHLKFSDEKLAKLIEFGRKENIKQLEKRLEDAEKKIKEFEEPSKTQSKKFDNAKELIGLLKDFKEEKSVEFQKFIEWTKQQ